MKLKTFLAGAALCLSTFSAQAVTVLFPTDGNVNFTLSAPFGNVASGDYLGLFDADTVGATDAATLANLAITSHLVIDTDQVVTFGPFGATDSQATSSASGLSLTLNGLDKEFIVGLYSGGTWYLDAGTSYVNLLTQSIILDFQDESGSSVYTVDVAAVPLPAAVWLFGAGLLGLVGVARRRG